MKSLVILLLLKDNTIFKSMDPRTRLFGWKVRSATYQQCESGYIIFSLCHFLIICKNHRAYAITFLTRDMEETVLIEIFMSFPTFPSLPCCDWGHLTSSNWWTGGRSIMCHCKAEAVKSCFAFYHRALGWYHKMERAWILELPVEESLCLPKSNLAWARNKLVLC